MSYNDPNSSSPNKKYGKPKKKYGTQRGLPPSHPSIHRSLTRQIPSLATTRDQAYQRRPAFVNDVTPPPGVPEEAPAQTGAHIALEAQPIVVQEPEKPKNKAPQAPKFLKKYPELEKAWIQMILGWRNFRDNYLFASGKFIAGIALSGWKAIVAGGKKIGEGFAKVTGTVSDLAKQLSDSGKGGEAGEMGFRDKLAHVWKETNKKMELAASIRLRKAIIQGLAKGGLSNAGMLMPETYGDPTLEAMMESGETAGLPAIYPDRIPKGLASLPKQLLPAMANQTLIQREFGAIIERKLEQRLTALGFILACRIKAKETEQNIYLFNNLLVYNFPNAMNLEGIVAELQQKWRLHPPHDLTPWARAALNFMGQGQISRYTYEAIMAGINQFNVIATPNN